MRNKYPMVLVTGKWIYIFNSRWTLFPIMIETSKMKELIEND